MEKDRIQFPLETFSLNCLSETKPFGPQIGTNWNRELQILDLGPQGNLTGGRPPEVVDCEISGKRHGTCRWNKELTVLGSERAPNTRSPAGLFPRPLLVVAPPFTASCSRVDQEKGGGWGVCYGSSRGQSRPVRPLAHVRVTLGPTFPSVPFPPSSPQWGHLCV